jgi:malate dehydrogenase (oxaloacetate-decarboxylating)(NADP+)
MAFTLEERQHMGIHGLLPPAVLSQDIQALRVMINFHRLNSKFIFYELIIKLKLFCFLLDDLDRYSELMNLSDRNEKLFYRVIADNPEEIIPIVYTPTGI